MLEALAAVSIAIALFATLMLALEIGYRKGRCDSSERDAHAGSQVGAIQGAVLGLMGLLLAFSFAAAGGRFLERQDLIVKEANAIGTAYLRADLLEDPHKTELRSALQKYTEHRIDVSERSPGALSDADADLVQRMHARIWNAASAGVSARPAFVLGVLPPVNDLFDVHSERIAAGRKHIPWLVMGLLIACSVMSLAIIGYGCGLSGHRRALLTISLALIVGTSLWITLDLDHPRAGLLRLSDAPLKALQFAPPRTQAPTSQAGPS